MGIPLPPLSVLLRDALKDYRAALPEPPVTSGIEQQPSLPQFAGIRKPEIEKKSKDDVLTLFPRRKAGQAPQEGGKGPVVLSVELLEKFYGMPLHTAAKKLVKLHVEVFPFPFQCFHEMLSKHCISFSALTV